MVNVKENYKLLEIFSKGKVIIEKVITTEAWNVFEFEFDGNVFKVSEGDEIQFVIEDGELKIGTVLKISGKGEKTKIKIAPKNQNCEEIWSVMSIKEGTFKVLVKDEETDEDDMEDVE